MGHISFRTASRLLPLALGVSLVLSACSESIPFSLLEDTPTPTLTPLPTSTTVLSPTTTPVPITTPTPALPADQALEAGQRRQLNGDYEAAIAAFQSIISVHPDSPEAREALYYLGDVYLVDHDYTKAMEALSSFRERYPDDERYPFATFRLATAYENLALWDEAITAYQEYGDQRTIISDYVHLNVGYALLELERYEEAREEFAQVLDLGPPATLEQQALRNMALASRYLDEYEQAIAYYGQLLDLAQEDGTRAETLFQTAVTYQEWEDPDQAAQVFTQLAQTYPRTYRAYQALEELDAMEVSGVNDFQRGLIYYYNGLYDPAVLAFYDYIENVEDTAEAHYYAALAYRAYYTYYLSIDELQTIIDDFPSSELVGEAWWEIARSWVLIGDNETATGVYTQFFASRPQDPLADDAQWKVASLLEDEGEFEQAIAAYTGLAETLPAGEYAAPSLFRAGLAYYRLARYDEAYQTWERLLEDYPQSEMRPRTLYWLGKTHLEQGDQEGAFAYLNELVIDDTGAYYSLRAADLLRAAPPQSPSNIYALDLYDMADEAQRLDLEQWLVSWAGPQEGEQLSDLGARITSDPTYQRGLELLHVGQRESAKARFREVRTQFQNDPVALYQLALFFQREGFYDQSIACAQRILNLSPQDSLYDVPRLLQKLHYPVYFADLIVPQAEKRGLDPLVFCALIWQESWYDPSATSSYPARGLTQFIESTADWVAEELGLTEFSQTDLFRPVVAVEFAGWYLEWITNYEDGELFRVLAHYNAGPGSVARWRRDGEVTDIDLFVEEVDYDQTETFIHRIYQHYWAYRDAYYGSQ